MLIRLRSLLHRNLFKPANFRPSFKRFVSGSDIDIEVDEKDERWIHTYPFKYQK